MTSAREKAVSALEDVSGMPHPGHATAAAIVAVGWSVLDLADAIREGRPFPTHTAFLSFLDDDGHWKPVPVVPNTPPEGLS